MAFIFVLLLSKSHGGYKLFDEKGPARNGGILIASQIAGILWFGIIPVFVSDHSWNEIVLGKRALEWFPVLIILFLLITDVFFARKQSENLFIKIISDQKNVTIFSSGFVIRYVLLRILFLCAYEIFFRGYLLTDSIHYLGITTAVLLNVALYVLLHVPAGKKEMIACIPFGTLLCMICIWMNAAWPAIVLHVALSLTYDFNLVQKFSKPINALL